MARRIHEAIKKLGSFIHIGVKDGPLKGRKWIVSTGWNFTRGQYEVKKTAAVERVVRNGDVVYDVGAHVDYFSLIMAQSAGSGGHVYSFEPRPLNRNRVHSPQLAASVSCDSSSPVSPEGCFAMIFTVLEHSPLLATGSEGNFSSIAVRSAEGGRKARRIPRSLLRGLGLFERGDFIFRS